MRIVCVDDEALLARSTAALCRSLPEVDAAEALTSGRDALDWFEKNEADIAILDIDMPEIGGLQLAARIKVMRPDTRIIFLTGYSQFALDAFKLRASGYLLKPVDETELANEIRYAAFGEDQGRSKSADRVVIRTFGSFDVFAGGRLVTFRQKRSKELLAILVDRQGGSISRAEAFALIYEDRLYDRRMQKQFDNIIRSMRDTLREYGIEDIFEMKSGQMRICPEKVSCDLYRFLDGDAEAVNRYRGEYMSAYSWACAMEGFVTNNTIGANKK
ncbi:MAG: response regulator [Firmicutes bacterium]|nr:response regulator [Bacillota bacterium]